MDPVIFRGNSGRDSQQNGWIGGPFMPPDIRRTSQIEIRHAHLPQGAKKSEWSAPIEGKTCWIMFSGCLRNEYSFNGIKTALTCQGDQYAIIASGGQHRWEVEQDCEVLAVRWPVPKKSYGNPRAPEALCAVYPLIDALSVSSLVGQFVSHDYSIEIPSPKIEIEHMRYKKNQSHASWPGENIITMILLVSGHIAISLPGSTHAIMPSYDNGDYTVMSGVAHYAVKALVPARFVTISWSAGS